jgi:hypothetical protein
MRRCTTEAMTEMARMEATTTSETISFIVSKYGG